MKPILEVENIGKKYLINHENQQPYLSLRESMSGLFKSRKSKEEFWALKDVSFTVDEGESIGIIGKNGAGKSTLLKILSKITPPTTGLIKCRGRVASLLEVGTGFHPELTGRENIFMNGSILGMKRFEIQKNFDAIVDFSGVEKFLDTPLKHYSSGMQLRLAFAVAAFLENEILIIDEVLAVGDAEFQKKCMGKMGEVSKSGRTVLFVSHNLAAVNTLCPKSIFLENGQVKSINETSRIINQYINSGANGNKYFTEKENSKNHISSITLKNNLNEESSEFDLKDEIIVEIHVKLNEKIERNFTVGVSVLDELQTKICTTHFPIENNTRTELIVRLKLPNNFFSPKNFSLDVAVFIPGINLMDYVSNICNFNIINTESILYSNENYGSVLVDGIWDLI